MCNCNSCSDVSALQGEKGDDGTSSVLATSEMSGVAATHYVYTGNRLATSSDNIYNAGSGYQWSIMTVPAIGATNVAIFHMSAQINATDVHAVTATVLVNGVAAANVTAKQNMGTFGNFNWGFQLGGLSQNDVIIIKLLSDGVAVTPVLRGGLVTVNLYS